MMHSVEKSLEFRARIIRATLPIYLGVLIVSVPVPDTYRISHCVTTLYSPCTTVPLHNAQIYIVW